MTELVLTHIVTEKTQSLWNFKEQNKKEKAGSN